MTIIVRGAVCAAVISFACIEAQANPLQVNVPVGQAGSPTGRGLFAAEQEIAKIPGGADVVPASDFQPSYALTMKDMTAKTPGVLAQPRWGEEQRLSIRGSGLSRAFHLRGIALLQDGVPFNFADGSGDFQEIDPLVLQHIEIYRGGHGLRYGAGTLGGAINMVTPTARTVDYHALMRVEAGSYQTLRLHAQAAKALERYDAFAATTKSISDGYRRQSEQSNQRFSGNIGALLGDGGETRFYISYNDIEQEVPGTISKQAARNNPTSVPAINEINDYARDIHSLRLANKTVFELHNGLNIELGAYLNDKTLYHPIFQVVDQKSSDVGGYGRIKGLYANNEFILGLNGGGGVNNAKRFINIRGRRGSKTADGQQIAQNLELYGENRYHLTPALSLIGGAQAALAFRDYADTLNSANDDDKFFKSFNPKLGVMWEPRANTQLFASVTRSSEAPTFSELVQGTGSGFVPLKLQTAWTAEIGARGEQGAFSWDMTLYHSRLKNELLNFTVTPDVPASTFNADDTIHQGLELGASWQANDEWSFQTIYNLNDFRFDGDDQFGDNDLAGAPKHQIRLSARYEKDGFFIEPNLEWIPQAPYVDYANNLKADNYALPGLKAGYDINGKISVFLDAHNLTNTDNVGSFNTITNGNLVGTNVFYPGEGRSAFVGMVVKF